MLAKALVNAFWYLRGLLERRAAIARLRRDIAKQDADLRESKDQLAEVRAQLANLELLLDGMIRRDLIANSKGSGAALPNNVVRLHKN